MTEPNPIPQINLDYTARQWFTGLHQITPGSGEYTQLTSSIAYARGYDLENMTQIDVEDLYTTIGTLSLFSAMQTPEQTGYTPDDATTDYLNREARGVVRDIMALAYVDNDHYGDLEQSYRDTMTDALNERGLNRYLRRKFGFDMQQDRRASLEETPQEACIGDDDLTNFKRINSILGERVGDDAIREAYDELEDNLRLSDDAVIARYRRGDEFEILLSGVELNELTAIENRLINLQLEKVKDGRYINAWDAIYAIRDQLIAAGVLEADKSVPARVEIEEIDEKPTRVLYIGEQRMMPLREIVVHSVGFARGRLESWENHVELHELAKAANKARKTMLHLMMGGADRAD